MIHKVYSIYFIQVSIDVTAREDPLLRIKIRCQEYNTDNTLHARSWEIAGQKTGAMAYLDFDRDETIWATSVDRN